MSFVTYVHPVVEKITSDEAVLTYGTRQLALVSGALRNAGSGWEVLQGSAHQPSGISGVVATSTRLEILHPVSAVKVVSLAVTVDEWFAKLGIFTGASVGLDHSYIYMYNWTGAIINPLNLVAPSGNLWVQGYFLDED